MNPLHLTNPIFSGKSAFICPKLFNVTCPTLGQKQHYGKTTTDFNMVFKQQINIVDSTFARHRNWMGSKHMDGQYFPNGLRARHCLREGDLPGGVQA